MTTVTRPPIPGTDDGTAVSRLGLRVHSLRKLRNWTLKDLADRSGVSRSTLSKVERDEVSPTYDVIQRLARGFGMSVVEFFDPERSPSTTGRRAVNRANAEEAHQGRGYLYRVLSAELSKKIMLPFHATIEARSIEEAGGYVRHSGEEFLFVLSGEIAFHTEHYAPVRLKEGDSIYIDSTMGHACISLSATPAEVIWITADRLPEQD